MTLTEELRRLLNNEFNICALLDTVCTVISLILCMYCCTYYAVSGKQARLAELRCSLRGLGGEGDKGNGEDMDHSGSKGGGEEGECATEDTWHTLM